MTIICGYCEEPIKTEYAKHDRDANVYLHDGESLGEMNSRLTAGFPFGSGFPTEKTQERIVYQRSLPQEKRFCAQSYKFNRVMQGHMAILNKVRLEDLAQTE